MATGNHLGDDWWSYSIDIYEGDNCIKQDAIQGTCYDSDRTDI